MLSSQFGYLRCTREPVGVRLARLAVVVSGVAAVLTAAGCGGGGTPSGNALTSATGRVAGSVSTASGTSSTSLKATLDGTSYSAPVDSSGNFVMPQVPPGTYNCTVTNANGSAAGHISVQVAANSTTTATVSVLPAGGVAGIVSKFDASNTLVADSGVTVTLTAQSGEAPPVPIFAPASSNSPATTSAYRGRQSTTTTGTATSSTTLTLTQVTDANGNFNFEGVPAGLYQVSATDGSLTAQDFVSVGPAESTSANLTLVAAPVQETATVSGTVSDASGNPITGAYVRYVLNFPCVATATPATSSTKRASAARQAPSPNSGVQIGVAGPTTAPVGGVIASPCADAIATAFGGSSGSQSAGAMVPGGAVTDSSGHYTFTVPASVTALVASAQGYVSQNESVTLTAGGTQTVNFTLTAVPARANLSPTLTVNGGSGPITYTAGTTYNFTMTLTNTTSAAVTVNVFGTGGALQLLDVNGNDVWDSTYGMMLPDVVSVQTIQPGKSITSTATWSGTSNFGSALPNGTYTFQGSIAGYSTSTVTMTVTGSTAPVLPSPVIMNGGAGVASGGSAVGVSASVAPTS